MLEFKRFLAKLIDNPNPIIFEIGTGAGDDTLEFVEAFKDTNFTLYCFEPDQRNIAQFKKKIHDKRVNLYEGVVGNTSGMTNFYTSLGRNSLSSSLRQPGEDLFKTWPELFKDKNDFLASKINSIRLDDFCNANKIEDISFVWMDCQGAEDIIIEGGKETFANKIHFLYTEYSNAEIYKDEPTLTEILSLLPGYEVLSNFPNLTGDTLGGDILLVNKNKETVIYEL
jgi:FkbM family methyltransferase